MKQGTAQEAKDYFANYVENDIEYPANTELYRVIMSYNPTSVFEFGCGQGKNLRRLRELGVSEHFGIDISKKAVELCQQKGLDVMVGEEANLPQIRNSFDIAFTCSVLDHIPDIDSIITELKRIAPVVILLETNSVQGSYYYPHDYEGYGFKKTGYSWRSTADKALYEIWVWEKEKPDVQ